jgi:hypothetical protein
VPYLQDREYRDGGKCAMPWRTRTTEIGKSTRVMEAMGESMISTGSAVKASTWHDTQGGLEQAPVARATHKAA